jgi:hypothetical protein
VATSKLIEQRTYIVTIWRLNSDLSAKPSRLARGKDVQGFSCNDYDSSSIDSRQSRRDISFSREREALSIRTKSCRKGDRNSVGPEYEVGTIACRR